MNLELTNNVIVISGGAGEPGSIGETMVRAFAGEGALPIILDIDSVRGKALEQELNAQNQQAFFIQADLTQPEACETAIHQTLKNFGRIDCIINNLGVNDGVGLSASAEAFLDSLKLNLLPAFSLAKYSREALIATQGSLINIGSKVALTGQGGTSAYAAAKGGLLALTREWAVDLVKHNIRSNAILIAESWTPGYDSWVSSKPNKATLLEKITSRIPLENRMTRPQEIADLALFLASKRASHITGQYIFVDGGYVHLDRALQDLT